MRPDVPPDILALGRARAAARRAHDYREADRLKASIEQAGYRVVDKGGEFRLVAAHPAQVTEEDGRVRYGWSGGVPSRLREPASLPLSVIVVARSGPDAVVRSLESLRAHAPAGTHVLVVAAPEPELEAALLAGPLRDAGAGVGALPVSGAPEAVWTAVPFSPAAARNAGGRRARGSVVAWLQAGVVLSGDALSPLVAALADPTVAVAGAVGLGGHDIRRLAPVGAGDVVAIEASLLAFRRAEIGTLGPIDERLFGDEQIDRWWSLVLRAGVRSRAAEATPGPTAEGEEPAPIAARRAVALDLPVDVSGARPLPAEPTAPEEAARRRKRDLYRLIDRFTGRRDLLDPRPIP